MIFSLFPVFCLFVCCAAVYSVVHFYVDMSLGFEAFITKRQVPGSGISESKIYLFLIITDIAKLLSRGISLIHISNQKFMEVPTSPLAMGIVSLLFFHLINVN